MKKILIFLKNRLKNAGQLLEKIVFVCAAFLALIIIVILVGLLKITRRLKEIDLEPFPKNRKKMIVVTNHPDGNEWIFVYRRFFRWIYLVAAPVLLVELPFTLANRMNFKNPILRVVALALIFVDPGTDHVVSRETTIRRSIRVLKSGIPVIGFFEGGRTRKRTEFVFSKKGKTLGKLNKSLGHMVKTNSLRVKPAWIELKDCSFYSLPDNGRFSVRRFFVWYWRTLTGKNGSITILWGKSMYFEHKKKEEITQAVEDYLLELADQT